MLEPSHPIHDLLRRDRRYKIDAYALVFEALSYAQTVLEMGHETCSVPSTGEEASEEGSVEQHVTGQELCEAIRQLSLEQYGYMAKTVLNSWGIRSTGDVGEIVFNLIHIGQMRKTATDRREDFNDVFDFDVAFRDGFKIEAVE